MKARLWSKANIRTTLPVPSGSVNKKNEVTESCKSDNFGDFKYSDFTAKGKIYFC